MTNTRKFWIPMGDLTPAQAHVLAVPASAKPDWEVHKFLLTQKLQRLIDQNPQEAREALEMSQEQAPELSLIAQDQLASQWSTSLTNSDSMQNLLSQIDWSQPGQLQSLPEQELRSLLEQLP